MKKVLTSLLVILLLSGCSYPNITKMNKLDVEQTVYTILPLKVKMHNKNGNGYKYYMPKGVTRFNTKKFNEVLKKDSYKYYLYIDMVDYYYKTESNYKINKNAFYSDKISYKNKKGYLEITKSKDKMYVVMYYNYAKIETYVDKKDLTDTVRNLSYILSSVEFNDSLITRLYESGSLGSKEEVYKLFDNKEKDGNFIEYIEEYDNYNSKNDTSSASNGE